MCSSDLVAVPAAARRILEPGVTWGSWHVPVPVELAIVAAIGLLLLLGAIIEFRRTE